jgi:uncharacterized phage infection (PIP) family protein YhgE
MFAASASAIWVLRPRFSPRPCSTPAQAQLLSDGATLTSPGFIAYLVGALAPVFLFFTIAFLVYRAAELRIVAKSMANVTMRMAQPDELAKEQVMSVSQAIRREVAAMGDGVERALARAGELESMVQGEVANLERAYSDNETKLRTLLGQLTSERQDILLNAEKVREAISSSHDRLNADLLTASDALTQSLAETGSTVAHSLADKASQITNALSQAGETMSDTLQSHGDRSGRTALLDRPGCQPTSWPSSAAILSAKSLKNQQKLTRC